MSRLRTPVGRNDARDELLHGVTGKDFSWGDITIRIGDLPLFRRAESRLRQALRIVVHAPADLGRAGVHVRDAGRDIDHKAVEINAGPNRVLLFVPEVDAPRPVEVVISLEGRRSSERWLTSPRSESGRSS